jgi:hypothetical protein
VWTDSRGCQRAKEDSHGCQRAQEESVEDHEGMITHKENAKRQSIQSDMKEAVKTVILQHDIMVLNLTTSSCPWPRTDTNFVLSLHSAWLLRC